ncbi:MAG: hypothetical protein P8Q90_07205 [Candidatus Thalassarchaeaceae archaeon]|nr:hypothetical protein [Candidatus Thalassarchaeaceae archaeon]
MATSTNLVHFDDVGRTIIATAHYASNMSGNEPTPEQQLAATQQFSKILPFILGFSWIIAIPVSYLFIAPVISDETLIRIGITILIAIANGVADVVFVKIMAKNVETMKRNLEKPDQESGNGEEYSPNNSILN